MTTLMDLINRKIPPVPWELGGRLPWQEPGFSERMLQEHLSQDHDMASPRTEKIEKHVDWIHTKLLSQRPSRILDLGCGPGLYTNRLARLGHQCVGIDVSPASITYARQHAEKESLRCTYMEQDMRDAQWGTTFNLVMMLHGEFNTFRPTDARKILRQAHAALAGGGLLLVAVATFAGMESTQPESRSWSCARAGLFSAEPHLCLEEVFWDRARKTKTECYVIIDASTAQITLYADSQQAYTDGDYESLLAECGFSDVQLLPPLPGMEDHLFSALTIVAKRRR